MNKKDFMFKVTLLTALILTFNSFSHTYWYANYSENAFKNEIEGSLSLNNFVVDGAGYFLESYADTLLFMKKIELSGKTALDYDELRNLVDKALDNMKSANEAYFNLKQAADNTAYNPAVIDALKNFDYDRFKEANFLNEDIFKEVKYYLVNGDIRGVYARIITDTGNLILLLERVKKRVEKGRFPVTADVWQLNQSFSQSFLFGQYTGQIFAALINRKK